jgi:hypothetical protein
MVELIPPTCEVILHDGRAEQLDGLWRNGASRQNPQVWNLGKRDHYVFDLVDATYERAEASTRPQTEQLPDPRTAKVCIDEQNPASTL